MGQSHTKSASSSSRPRPSFELATALTDVGDDVRTEPLATDATCTPTYFDTADLRLARGGASLRYRDATGGR